MSLPMTRTGPWTYAGPSPLPPASSVLRIDRGDVVLRGRPACGVADLEHLRREPADRGGDVAHSAGDDRGHLPDRRGRGLDGPLHGVLADLCSRQLVLHLPILRLRPAPRQP